MRGKIPIRSQAEADFRKGKYKGYVEFYGDDGAIADGPLPYWRDKLSNLFDIIGPRGACVRAGARFSSAGALHGYGYPRNLTVVGAASGTSIMHPLERILAAGRFMGTELWAPGSHVPAAAMKMQIGDANLQ
jgi:hypothetical protein